ncbi:MAG: CbbQ/NirQ/NorQ/GpvN family protein [Rhizobacter sp.]|nr:CbbQ/NirQ/NorQ/GpvN family protein [Rhizobacter sp.]
MATPLEAWRIASEPFYSPVGDEVALFESAYARRLPLLLKGPTGCGKTRLVEYMAWRLSRPLVTVACNEDLSANDLVGRWLLDADGTRWQDGPLALAARHGAICYLDEVVEARADTTTVIHPLTDTRRMLPLAARSETLRAHPDFALVVSYNPGPAVREMKTSTRQRFCALTLGYPDAERESLVVAREAGIELDLAADIVAFGIRTRRLQGHGLEEGASTRMLVHAGVLAAQGIALPVACRMALVDALTDDDATCQALEAALEASF